MNSVFETESHTIHSLEEKAIELDLLAAAGIQALPSANSPSRSMNGHGGRRHHQQLQQGNTPSHAAGSQANNSWAGKRSRLADF
jgi:hypothetical protein